MKIKKLGKDFPIDISFLPFAAKNYNISPNIEDYLIFSTIICPAGLPNRNGIAFPIEELVKLTDPPDPHFVYKGWVGCPVHVEHQNEDKKTAVGVVFDTSLKKAPKIYGNGKLYNVIGILGIDRKKAPEIAEKFEKGEINTVSMGALAGYCTCSYCGAVCTAQKHCSHVKGGSECVNFTPIVDSLGNVHLAFLNAHDLECIEVSIVKDPAWAPAQSDYILNNRK